MRRPVGVKGIRCIFRRRISLRRRVAHRLAVPITINQTDICAFCAEEDAVVRVEPKGACSNTEPGVVGFNPLNQ